MNKVIIDIIIIYLSTSFDAGEDIRQFYSILMRLNDVDVPN